jgi:hypothetical protein
MDVRNVVNVTLTRETRTVSQQGFGTILVLGPNLNVGTRTAEYNSLTALALELIGGSSAPEYVAAQAILAQSPRVVTFKVGCQAGQRVITDDAGTFTAGTISGLVNGTLVSTAFTTDKDTTMTAFAAAIQALDSVSTAVYSSGSHTITITPATDYVLGVTVSTAAVTGTMTVAVTSVATEDPDDALDAIRLYDDDWYASVYVDRTQADVEGVVAWTEANGKTFITATDDSDVYSVTPASDTTSLPAVIKAAAYERTVCVYNHLSDTTYPEAAALGKVLPYHPGEYTLKFKTLAGVTRSILSETQSSNARGKNCLTYETVGGVNVTTEGMVASGENFDVIVFCDWLVSRCQEAVYSTFVAQLKVPFDDRGIQSVRNVLEAPFNEGIRYGGLSDFAYDDAGNQIGGYYFIVPKYADVSAADRAARSLTGIECVGFLAGAIHSAAISIKIAI